MDARLPREVDDGVGPGPLHGGRGLGGVLEVGGDRVDTGRRAPRRSPAREHHPVNLRVGVCRAEVIEEVAADEAAGAGDEEPHR